MITLWGVKNAIQNRKRNYSTKFCKLPPFIVYEVEQKKIRNKFG